MAVIFILGNMCAGKTTLANGLLKEKTLKPIRLIKEHTTRPKRNSDEKELVFLTPREFSQINGLDEYIGVKRFNAAFGVCSYAILKEDLRFCKTNRNGIIVTNPMAYIDAREYCGLQEIPIFTVLLNPTLKQLRSRAYRRGDDKDEVKRRIADMAPLIYGLSKSDCMDLIINTPMAPCELVYYTVKAFREKITS